MTQVRIGVSLFVAVLASPLLADDPPGGIILSGESRAVAQAFADVRKSLAGKKWTEAIDRLQVLIDKGADDLVAVGPRQTIQARRLAHMLLAALPPDALEQYRNRVEAQARRALEQGLAQHDARGLRKLVDEAFCSRAAEKALDALGDLAFERGDFVEAESWWRLLLPEPSANEPRYPRPTMAPARLQAKLLLARLFRDGAPAMTADLQAYHQDHGKAEGTLAGRTGTYASTLSSLAQSLRPPQQADVPWSTFGGAPTRGLVVPAPINMTDRLGQLCQKRRWLFNLQGRERVEQPPLFIPGTAQDMTWSRSARTLAFYPVIAGGKVIVADARYVTAYDLQTGASEEWFDAARDNGGITPILQLPAPADLRYTVTVAGDCVYARLGEQAIRVVDEAAPAPGKRPAPRPESLLVCLGLQPGPGGERLRWQVRPGIANDNAVFEGAPLVHGGLVYIAATRFVQGRAVTAIHCYAAAGNGAAPLRWRKDVCEARDAPPEEKRYRHHLLTAAGPNVVYCSHSGAVVALDALTGRRAWGVRYPQRPPLRPDEPPPLTDLCPCLYANGRVYVAPADANRLFCLDALSGRVVWEETGISVVHLLGVTQAPSPPIPFPVGVRGEQSAGPPLLIFTRIIRRNSRWESTLQAVNAEDSKGKGGWSQTSDLPLGRGLLLGDLVLWPTWGGVRMLRQRDGEIADNPTLVRNIPAGNLAFGQGCLAVADRRQLTVFVPPAGHLRERLEQSRLRPGSVETMLALASAQADAGDFVGAQATLSESQAGKQASSQAVAERIVTVRHGMLLDQAARNRREADALLTRACDASFPAQLRLRAFALRAGHARKEGDLKREVAVWQALLAEPGFRDQTWVDGVSPVPAVAREQLARLRQAAGPAVFEEQEKAAQAILATAGDDLPARARQGALEQLAQAYPCTRAARTALRELGRIHDRTNHFGAAADAYRRLLASAASSPDEEANDLIGLATAYEKEQCWEAARGVWQQLQRRHGDRPRLDQGPKTIREYAAERLRALERATKASQSPLPLSRAWHQTLTAGEFLLTSNQPVSQEGDEQLSPVADAPGSPGITHAATPIYTARSERGRALLLGRAPRTGEPTWQCPLGFVPETLGFHADLVLAAGPAGLACIRKDDGRCQWQLMWEQGLAAHGLQVKGGRAYLMQGGRRFLAYEAETGRLLWSLWPPGGPLAAATAAGGFRPGYRIADETVLLQTATGRRWLLNAANGRLLRDEPTDHEPWPVVTVDPGYSGSLPCLVREGGRIVRLDPAFGTPLWHWDLPGNVQLTGDPVQLRVTAQGILVLTPVNRGQHLQRLDPKTGKALWDREAILATGLLDLSAWSVDARAVYLVREQTLLALDLAAGKVLWEHPLADGPRGDWRTNLLLLGKDESALVVYPDSIPARVWRFSWLFGSVQWIVGGAPEGQVGQGCPILCCDCVTGKLIQRLNLAAGPPWLEWSSSAELAQPSVLPRLTAKMIARGCPLSCRVAGVKTGMGAPGIVTALAGHLWGFSK